MSAQDLFIIMTGTITIGMARAITTGSIIPTIQPIMLGGGDIIMAARTTIGIDTMMDIATGITIIKTNKELSLGI